MAFDRLIRCVVICTVIIVDPGMLNFWRRCPATHSNCSQLIDYTVAEPGLDAHRVVSAGETRGSHCGAAAHDDGIVAVCNFVVEEPAQSCIVQAAVDTIFESLPRHGLDFIPKGRVAAVVAVRPYVDREPRSTCSGDERVASRMASVGTVVFPVQWVRRIVRHVVDESIHGIRRRREDSEGRAARDLIVALGCCSRNEASGKGDEHVLSGCRQRCPPLGVSALHVACV